MLDEVGLVLVRSVLACCTLYRALWSLTVISATEHFKLSHIHLLHADGNAQRFK